MTNTAAAWFAIQKMAPIYPSDISPGCFLILLGIVCIIVGIILEVLK